MREAAEPVPKPLVEIGGRPVLWHVMALFAAQGMSRFVLLLGHGGDQLRNDGRVDGFEEKPRLDSWVNGGFFVMEPAALGFIGADDVLERDPLESLAGAGELFAYRHEGFWDCMDTYKDTLLLNELWDRGRAPWRELVGA